MKLTIKCLPCSTKSFSFSRHTSQLDAMFASRGRNDVIIPVYSEYSAPLGRMLGIHSMYTRIGIATQSMGYSWLFHLFLFRNKVNRTHPYKVGFTGFANNCFCLFVCLFFNFTKNVSVIGKRRSSCVIS